MMGTDHALSGACAGVATLSLCPHPDPAHQAAWVAAWTGSALLLDWDTKRSMAARMWGPASGLIESVVSTVAGGHRHLTHDPVLAPLLLFVMVSAASTSHWGRMLTVAVVLGLAARALLVATATWFTGLCTLAVSIAGAYWVVSHNLDLGAGLLTCIMGGALVHLAGDLPTVAMLPMPIAWMFGSRARVGIPLFRAGKAFERLVVMPTLVLLLGWLTNRRYEWWPCLAAQLHTTAMHP